MCRGERSFPVVTADDYPIESLKRDEVGKVRFGIVIGTDGGVKTCVVLRSSGSERLDSRTCAIMQARLRFKPARDSEGNAVEDRSWGEVNWILQPVWRR
jgi:periplasmic protein TonB